MSDLHLKTPVLFLVFNRPDTTKKVFEAIKQAKPKQLFVAADGPRENKLGDAEKCAQVRRIIESVDWECDVVTLFREKNLGCKIAVSSAIDWFFENVEGGIVLEDDCLPSYSFFSFCEELLQKYQNDTRVMQICGSNLVKERSGNVYSYMFSNYGPVWGWATWRRAWNYYDVDMKLWPEVRDAKLYEHFCQSYEESMYRSALYNKVFAGEIDTWDYQWGFAKMINHGLSIIPAFNLVSNVGFGFDSTHTSSECSFSNLELCELSDPISHPPYVIRDKSFDAKFNDLYVPPKKSVLERIFNIHKM
ncbi:glycosyltransferase family 2 protein [Deltaproteobacteria bacterium IMCC39524]|nr:glycosyltransferase family 2 protein [Deltaproteobacteria bacterium IMCC39524]